MSIEPELWVEDAPAAVAFYVSAFAAAVLHRVGEGGDIVTQLAVGDGRFWVAPADPAIGRLSPSALGGRTSRTLLIVEEPHRLVDDAVGEGARVTSPVGEEHGWLLGRIVDPHGHEWEIGRPLSAWPPRLSGSAYFFADS